MFMQQQCEPSKNEKEHLLFTDTLRETSQDVNVVFPHATGGSCIRMQEQASFLRVWKLVRTLQSSFQVVSKHQAVSNFTLF